MKPSSHRRLKAIRLTLEVRRTIGYAVYAAAHGLHARAEELAADAAYCARLAVRAITRND